MEEVVSVVGLGYVGLPLACALAHAGIKTIGYDIDRCRVRELLNGHDRTSSVGKTAINSKNLTLTDSAPDIRQARVHIVTVPTPINPSKRPDLGPLKSASKTVGAFMKPNDIVVFESTVYPGATEEIAVPLLQRESGLCYQRDFQVGYSPERINPGDKKHTISNLLKIVSASSEEALDTLTQLYSKIVKAGIYKAPSIKVAEAAKVIENTQRDLNIALMNELSMLFHAMDIDTHDVLEGASTKWNFLPFSPGLVGGHCIGVDPYYLTDKAHQLGFSPRVILAGRGTNEEMSRFIATEVIQKCVQLARPMPPRIAVLGITYKKDVPDTRNSKVIDLIKELERFGARVFVVDPLADPQHTKDHFAIELSDQDTPVECDAVILAVPHSAFFEKDDPWQLMERYLSAENVLVADLHCLLDRKKTPQHVVLWRL
ncbi:UDP-N-acetyl-D-glucosamine 6-dehydrogenase [Pseudovibrio axinellae]|uniref:UDP-N-acetyl-D-glucosamine 6-dehydrogenase n=1 Tax=Pseudovibrio axinellae TaxID=989403 RepID=A0A165YPP6_9HYPH|nr:nucleotide sugar dehydrogenase [Pseudovibrio axinellae]KZL19105.1 UDP-N-acetyl-D-glucosamine 6-dehydrogenase [Pseudovibrio axinellae]SER33471.1 UDP-N-acetyl-D-galactosamine dehydrogenase [Pseudovibrio axinellae]